MKKKYLLFVLIIFIFSCKKENLCDCFKGNGNTISEIRDIKGFDRIVTEDNINLFISEDSTFEVKIETGDNLIKLISTVVTDGELRIKNNNKCNFVRNKKDVNVYVRLPVIKYITSEGYGKIESLDTLTSPVFDIRTKGPGDIQLKVNNSKVISHMFGNGDIYLSGNTNEHACHIVGQGFANCSDLRTNYTWIYSKTSGNVYVNAKDLLQVILESSGNIYYSGNPQVDATVKGSGGIFAK